MKRLGLWCTGLVLTLAMGLVGCSDDTDTPDKEAGVKETGVTKKDGLGLPDGYVLWDCAELGKSCNAHDPCAIDPVCKMVGGVKKCVPGSLQDCSDGLACTTDTCAGLGVCKNEPQSGWCALPVKVTGNKTCGQVRTDAGTQVWDSAVPSADSSTADATASDLSSAPDAAATTSKTIICCFKAKDRHPTDQCLVCTPTPTEDAGLSGDGKKWSPATGGSCDDFNACTKNDYCQNGQCQGTYYGNSCQDSLSCTQDICDGKGGCVGNKLMSNYCLISGVCYKDGVKHPGGSCYVCDVTKNQSNWTAIGNSCFIGGKCYKPGELDSTKCGTCDPTKSATAWTMLTGLCKINGVCYKKGDPHTGKCAECDPTTSTTGWTVKGDYCVIDYVCKNPKDTDSTKCSTCDPTKNKYAWTQLTGKCKIGSSCYSKGDLDTTKCGECDPAKSSTSWTPLKGKCMIHGACYADKAKHTSGCMVCDYAKDPKAWTMVTGVSTSSWGFELGSTTGWTISNSSTTVGWQAATLRASSGSYALYYGNQTAKNYATGSLQNSGSATSPTVKLTTGKKAGLSFMVWMYVESSSSYDKLTVSVNNTTVWQKPTSPTMSTWVPVSVDLSSYAGQSISIKFNFDTQDDVNNTTEGIYIDEIYVHHGC